MNIDKLAELFVLYVSRENNTLEKQAQQKNQTPALSVANKPAIIAPEAKEICAQIAKYKVEPYIRSLVYRAAKQIRGQIYILKDPAYMKRYRELEEKVRTNTTPGRVILKYKHPSEIARRQTARVVGKAFNLIAIIEVAEALVGTVMNAILSFADKIDVLIGILYEIGKNKPSDDLVQMAGELAQYARGIPEYYGSLQVESMGPQQLAAFRSQINSFQQFLQGYQPKFMQKFSVTSDVAAVITTIGSMKGQAEMVFAGINHDLDTMLGEIERLNHAAKDGDDPRMNRPEGTI